jgi:RNA polymerase sigma factor (sigma-70 family)
VLVATRVENKEFRHVKDSQRFRSAAGPSKSCLNEAGFYLSKTKVSSCNNFVNAPGEHGGISALTFFPTTHWTSLFLPILERTASSQQALERLFATYRQPILTFVRMHIRSSQDAEDLTHDFIERLLRRDDLVRMDRTKGKFRQFLCASIRNFLASHYEAMDALKRKELFRAAPIETLETEPSYAGDAEREFTRAWWRTCIDEALKRLRVEWAAAGHGALFDDLEPRLWDEKRPRSAELAEKYKTTANAVDIRTTRMRDRYRELLLAVISETVSSAQEIQEEIDALLQRGIT